MTDIDEEKIDIIIAEWLQKSLEFINRLAAINPINPHQVSGYMNNKIVTEHEYTFSFDFQKHDIFAVLHLLNEKLKTIGYKVHEDSSDEKVLIRPFEPHEDPENDNFLRRLTASMESLLKKHEIEYSIKRIANKN
jgi:hypothetical protein